MKQSHRPDAGGDGASAQPEAPARSRGLMLADSPTAVSPERNRSTGRRVLRVAFWRCVTMQRRRNRRITEVDRKQLEVGALGELLGIARFKFHEEGKLKEFKRLSAHCTEIVRTKDTGTLQYEIYLNDDE
jgi:hypothetical protein